MVVISKPLFVLSYGGGVNSTALFFYLLEKKRPLDLVIFADTGEETEKTYETVYRMKKLCNQHNIEFVTVKSKYGNMYDYYYKNKAVMSLMRRDCTGKFKISPIRQYLRKKYGKKQHFNMYIGIASDEWTRVRESDVQYITNLYPFVEDSITREGNKRILKENNITAEKSGCKGCMYQKRVDWLKMCMNDPKEFERHLRLEQNCSAYPRVRINPYYTLEDVKKSAKGQLTLTGYEDPEPTCDVSGSCFL